MRWSVDTAGTRLLTALTVALLALAVSAPTWAASPGNIRAQADVLRARQAATLRAEQVALLDLYALESNLSRARSDLAALRTRIDGLRREQDQTSHRLEIARRVVATTELALGRELRLLYEHGEPNALAVLLGSESLEAALDELDSIDRAARDHQRIIGQVRHARKQASALQVDLKRRQARLRVTEAKLVNAVGQLERSRDARAAFLTGLRSQRHLAAARIAGLEAQAVAAEEKSRRLAEEARARAAAAAAAAAKAKRTATVVTPGAGSSPVPSDPSADAPVGAELPAEGDTAATGEPGEKTLTVTVTAYVLRGRTATGLPTSWGIVAVDPNVIPLGTKMTIPGYGKGIAADTGSAVRGATIDVWVPDLGTAQAFGRRTVTIVLH